MRLVVTVILLTGCVGVSTTEQESASQDASAWVDPTCPVFDPTPGKCTPKPPPPTSPQPQPPIVVLPPLGTITVR